MAVLQQILKLLGLTLNDAKTKAVDAYKGKFNFLGFEIHMGKSHRTGNHYAHVQPAQKSLKAIKDRVTMLTGRNRTLLPIDQVVKEVNSILRGWVGYFHVRNCSKALEHVRGHVEQRLRTHLCKRHKVRGRKAGYARFDEGRLRSNQGGGYAVAACGEA